MASYEAHFVHKISPSSNDIEGPFELADGAFASRNTLARALRRARVLSSGVSLREMRVNGDKVIAFPRGSSWHSIAIVPSGEYAHHAILGPNRRSRYDFKKR